MSDITRDGLTADTVEAMALEWNQANPGKALRALLTDQCRTCGGSGVIRDYTGGVVAHRAIEGHYDEPCPDCGGRGWLPKDSLETDQFDDTGPVFLVPLFWLEVDGE